MGRKKHDPKMRRTSEIWSKHGAHKHRLECVRLLESFRFQARRLRDRLKPQMYGSVSDLMKRER